MASVNAVGNGLTGASGTGNFVGNDSPDITTPTIIGVTDASTAAAGDVGQVISSVILASSAVSLTTSTHTDVTSISLSAGDWDVWGNVSVLNSGGGASAMAAWVDATSATAPDNAYYTRIQLGTGNVVEYNLQTPKRPYSVSGTTTIYLGVDCVFASGSVDACGGIYARRVR